MIKLPIVFTFLLLLLLGITTTIIITIFIVITILTILPGITTTIIITIVIVLTILPGISTTIAVACETIEKRSSSSAFPQVAQPYGLGMTTTVKNLTLVSNLWNIQVVCWCVCSKLPMQKLIWHQHWGWHFLLPGKNMKYLLRYNMEFFLNTFYLQMMEVLCEKGDSGSDQREFSGIFFNFTFALEVFKFSLSLLKMSKRKIILLFISRNRWKHLWFQCLFLGKKY